MAAPLGYNYDVVHDGTAPVGYGYGGAHNAGSSPAPDPQQQHGYQHQYTEVHQGSPAPVSDYQYEIHQGISHDHGGFQYSSSASPDIHYGDKFNNPAGTGSPNIPAPEVKIASASTAEIFQSINWPDAPRFLRQSVVFDIFNGILDALLVLLAAAFLSMAIIAMRLEDTSTEGSFGEAFEEAMRLGPTIYPILFAAVAGRALKSIGRFRAERGSRITTLWPLMNNKTMFDAIVSQWQLAQFSIVASGLVLLWALSPLGGQAALRLVYRTNLTTTETHGIRYLDTGPLGNIFAEIAVIESNDVNEATSGLPATIPALYEAALMQDAATKRGPVDNWGNVKIPRVDRLDPSLADADGWFDIGEANSVDSFTSLLGLPIIHFPDGGVAEFTVESVYVVLSPPSQQSFGPERRNNETQLLFMGMEIHCLDCINRYQNRGSSAQIALEADRYEMLWGDPYPKYNASQLANMTYSGARSLRFDSGARGYGNTTSNGVSILVADVTQHFVESQIRCDFGSCKAVRARRSTTDHRHPNITSFDYFGVDALNMISVRSRADAGVVSSPSELFINDSSSSPVKTPYQENYGTSTVNLSLADPQEFADRASIILNTALQIFMAPSGYTGDLPRSNMSIYGVPHIPANGTLAACKALGMTSAPLPDIYQLIGSVTGARAPFVAADTTATLTLFREVYKPDRGWVAVLILSSAILIFIGVAGMALGSRARAPDVFDPLMALTYNNPHLNMPGYASTLSGRERARLLAGVTVRLGDVEPYAEVGKISLGQTAEVKRLGRGRMYA